MTVTSNILPERPLDALHALWNWKRSWLNLDPVPTAPGDSPMRHLSRVELATMRLRADLSAERVPCQGIVFDAAMRIAVWADRGVLPYMSGWTVAKSLQSLYYPQSWNAKVPVRGLDLLVAVDCTSDMHGVSVTLDAEPTDGLHHRPMRLRNRWVELE
ncbi:hypothetical protein [Curtobacterium sp. MCSS17_005]|uniref:hypothetical protein n=1 Tax=Curtobacterium sp. MCSS17_005 TaxID=2175641 RepID=UPI0011B44B35|nr:hypothetical protein [Curtobacterium sp. MCSS17_005]WIB33920.1 hypothetical protein DEJ20_05490 [Curtobacterium sp. MCSS17_005]